MRSDLFELDDSMHRYLIYRLGSEYYGSPLLSVKEIIKIKDIKSVPYMLPHFKGVINLRGQVISVVDLRIKFGITTVDLNKGLIIIGEGFHGMIGLIVDDLHSVKFIEPNAIDKNPVLETKIPLEFFLGIAKTNDGLVNLVNISECISKEDLKATRKRA